MIASRPAPLSPILTAPQPLAELSGVHKAYGKRAALRGFDLKLYPGEIVVLLGPNGAGKSTAINVLSGLREADAGDVRLFDGNPRAARTRRELGATPQQLDFPAMLRVREIVALVRAHYAQPVSAAELLEGFGLSGLADRWASGLSGGERRRLAVALAFAGRPRLVLLDEPTTGLDVEARRFVWRAVRDYVGAGGAVLLTTHYLEEADALATRVVVINNGRAIFSGSIGDIKARIGWKRLAVRAPITLPIAGITAADCDGDRCVLRTKNVDAVVAALLERGVHFDDIEIGPVSLEEAFLDLTERVS
jgi:ABC-2 type transport system ATP-binding protein